MSRSAGTSGGPPPRRRVNIPEHAIEPVLQRTQVFLGHHDPVVVRRERRPVVRAHLDCEVSPLPERAVAHAVRPRLGVR